MPNRNYGDGEAKDKLKDDWRFRPTTWPGRWIRARPSTGATTMPALLRSGAFGTFGARTEPDGMYIRLADNAVTADVLAIEICGRLQNLHDKRSRYAPSTSSLLLKLDRPWLAADQQVQHGAVHKRWETFGDAFDDLPENDTYVPVFRLRLFLLVPCEHIKDWSEKVSLEAHEYLLPHRALDDQY